MSDVLRSQFVLVALAGIMDAVVSRGLQFAIPRRRCLSGFRHSLCSEVLSEPLDSLELTYSNEGGFLHAPTLLEYVDGSAYARIACGSNG
jgi:hypothetical protein